MAWTLSTLLKGLIIQNEVDRTKQLVFTVSPASTTGTATAIVADQTANRLVTLPDFDLDLNNVITGDSVTTLTNKTIDPADNVIVAPAGTVLVGDGDNTAQAVTVTGDISFDSNGGTAYVGTVPILKGGTGQTTAPNAINALLPNQATHSGEFLTTNGSVASWSTPAGAGTVTNVATGTGLTGGPITTTGTISLADTAVTPGSYTNTNLTVDAQGRITAAATGSSGANTTLSNLTGTTAVNQELAPDANLTRDIGDGSHRWNTLFTGSISDNGGSTGNASDLLVADGAGQFNWTSLDNAGAANRTLSNLTAPTALPVSLLFSNDTSVKEVRTKTNASASTDPMVFGSGNAVGFSSGSTTLSSGDSSVAGQSGITTVTTGGATAVTGDLHVFTGPSSTSNSGNIIVSPGTAGAVRGTIKFQDGSEGTANYVWASTDINGTGHWTNHIVIQSGVTGSRPGSPVIGQQYFDTSLGANGKPIWYNGTNWVDAVDNIV